LLSYFDAPPTNGSPVCEDGYCTGSENYLTCPLDCDHDLVVVVEKSIADILGPSLMTYRWDLDKEGYLVRIEPWGPGTVEELKTFIFDQVYAYDVEGALLVGNLPTAWYEQISWGSYEEFPTDVFLQDGDATWVDADKNGIYDSHTELDLDIYVSRLPTLPQHEECESSEDFPECPIVYEHGGQFYASEVCIYKCPSGLIEQSWSPTEHPDVECCGTYFLKRYFDRVHNYRTYGSLVDRSAFVFIDDEWLVFVQPPFTLDSIYTTVHVTTTLADSTKAKYVEMLSGGGAEFVYQWMHSTPDFLFIDEGHVIQEIHRTQIGDSPHRPSSETFNLESSFMNMFNCEAVRFTIPNLGMAIAFQTDYGLAILGSTKAGGMNVPDEFHAALAWGTPWGESFRIWYNLRGRDDDEWYLGMVILGDPLLALSGDTASWMRSARPETEASELAVSLRQTMIDRSPTVGLDTFGEYKESNPQFFEDEEILPTLRQTQ